MRTVAAVLVELDHPLELAELEIPALKPGQVLVELAFSGVCHTQLLEARGRRGADPFLPHCLGHEGSGRVLELGAGVTKVKAGDEVVLSWIKGSGADVSGSVYDWAGQKVNAGAITTFGNHAVISENRLTRVEPGLPLREAALVGCAVATGAGSVFNTAGARPGQSIAIFGAGGVGLCAIAAAHAAGCTPIIAVDVLASKLEVARAVGADLMINASQTDPVAAIKAAVPGGVDLAIEASGRPSVMAWALESVRAQGGSAVIVGNAPTGQTLTLDPKQLNLGKRLLGTWGGDSRPDTDYPRYSRLIMSGRIDMAPLLCKSYRLEEINLALHELEAGLVSRPLVDFTN